MSNDLAIANLPQTFRENLPEALRSIQRFEVVDCIDDKHVPAVIPKTHGPWVRYEDHIAALAAGQAAAAQAVVQDDLITIHKPTTSAEMLWLLKLAYLVISDVDKTLEKTFAPAQPPAQLACRMKWLAAEMDTVGSAMLRQAKSTGDADLRGAGWDLHDAASALLTSTKDKT